ncbi:phosphatase PAP2 family protein [Kitasatospora paracochleata]|uniref:Undecaprenyl-diphosphatase n=1 Tax=Kitasatospora paracochleata TaxID=58354 RepID=A0ABT1J3P1_9ACTN|nr:phosphatase PAP2 family protein [Kitasatospora paracochleata]MCP2311774.1 undecaprenyl-diphosphatase [Kitasatospora paracochleata]
MAGRMIGTGRRWVAVAVTAWALFAVLAALIAANGWAPFGFEQAAVDWCAAHRPPAARAVAVAVTSLGTGVFPYLLAAAAGALALRALPAPRPRRRAAALLLAPLVWLIAGQLVRQGLMHAFGRPRPPLADRAVAASGFAFPSGHAFTATVCAGLLVLAIVRVRPSATRAAVAGAAGFAVVIGLSRVYLGVHWPLDVLGGWLLAAGWLAAATRVVPRPDTAAAPAEGSGQPGGLGRVSPRS